MKVSDVLAFLSDPHFDGEDDFNVSNGAIVIGKGDVVLGVIRTDKHKMDKYFLERNTTDSCGVTKNESSDNLREFGPRS